MQGIHARGTRASTTRSRRHAVSNNTRLAQADWQTQKQRQGTRRQVQSTRKQEGHAAQAPGPGEIRPSRMVNDGPNERSVGIRLRLVSEDLGLFLPGAQPISAPLAAESVGSCHLDWLRLSKMVEQDAPERAAGCPSTMPRGTVIRFRACIGRPCQRPGPLIALSLPSSLPSILLSIFLI